MKTVIVAGATSQAGLSFCELLKDKNLKIVAAVRNSNSPFLENIENIVDSVQIFDLHDSYSINSLISGEKPDYFINAAAASFVGSSNSFPNLHFESNLHAVLYQLEAIRLIHPSCRYVNFGSSEEFDTEHLIQKEKTLSKPRNFYGLSKSCAHEYVKMYRDVYDLYAVQNWSYNFESKFRSESFVLKKIAKGIQKIKKAMEHGETVKPLYLGNLLSSRDFSHADDVVEAYWMTLNQDSPKDYIISSGDSNKIITILIKFLNFLNIDFYVKESNLEKDPRKGKRNIPIVFCGASDEPIIYSSHKFYREEAFSLIGDNSLIKRELGWEPKKSIDSIISDLLLN